MDNDRIPNHKDQQLLQLEQLDSIEKAVLRHESTLLDPDQPLSIDEETDAAIVATIELPQMDQPSGSQTDNRLKVAYRPDVGYVLCPPSAPVINGMPESQDWAKRLKEIPLSIGSEPGDSLTIGRNGFIIQKDGQIILEVDLSSGLGLGLRELASSPLVSRRHVSFEVTERGLKVTDVSLNGTGVVQAKSKLDNDETTVEVLTDQSTVKPVLPIELQSVGEPSAEAGSELLVPDVRAGHDEKVRKGQDASYVSEEKGLFAVFDGAGGHSGGRAAAQAAKSAVESLSITGKTVDSEDAARERIRLMLERANAAVKKSGEGGITTGLISEVLYIRDALGNSHPYAAWASVGDSRIYLVDSRSQLRQLSRDEGEGHFLYNHLGDGSKGVRQTGVVALNRGDRLLLVTDGITGDRGYEILSDQEIIQTCRGNAGQVAHKLVGVSRKIDDGTAVVIEAIE